MNTGRIRVEIVAPVHNRREITLQCLRSLTRIDSTGLDVHVIIIDDGSTDGTSRAIRCEFPDVEVISGNGALWYTEGTNVGIRAALRNRADFVLMINDDEIFDRMFLRHLVETASTYDRSIVGPLLLLWDMPHKVFQVAPVWDTLYGDWHHLYQQTVWTVPDKVWEVDLIVGNCVLVPGAAFHECGLMDSRKYPNFGDATFTPKMKKRGWQLLIDPSARVFCQPNQPPPRLREMSVRQALSALLMDRRNAHNLIRRFDAYLDGAPSKFKGFFGFVVFLVRGFVTRGYRNTITKHEPPLTAIVASRVLDK